MGVSALAQNYALGLEAEAHTVSHFDGVKVDSGLHFDSQS